MHYTYVVKTRMQTFGDIAEQYLKTVRADRRVKRTTLAQYQCYLASVQRHWPGLADTPVGAITRKDCQHWVAARKKLVQPHHLYAELAMLKRILRLAQQRGLIADDPAGRIRHLRIERTRPFIPSRHQFTSIIVALGALGCHRAVDLVELLAYSGMRLPEAAALKWADIDFDDGTFFVRDTNHGTRKGRSRRVPLFPAMRVLLQRLQKRRPVGIKPGDRVLLTRDCKRAIELPRRSAGVPEFTLHCLRHFFAVNAITQGIDYELIAAWMGYTDGGLRVARLYAEFHQDPKEMAERMTYMAEARYEAPPMPPLRLPSFKLR